jgi:hypothetical protein
MQGSNRLARYLLNMEICDLPMYQNTAASILSGPLLSRIGLDVARGSSVIQSFLDEGITSSKMFDEVFLIHIINGYV